MEPIIWTVLPDATAVAAAARDRILAVAAESIAARGAFRLVLAGGETPRAVYRLLRETPTDWLRWLLWFGDERCLPSGDPRRNSYMAGEAWLDGSGIPAARIHAVPEIVGAGETAAECARAYAATLPDGPFDLVLLGLGEDGHTASLFPGHDWGVAPDAPPVLAVTDAPKLPPQRISLSAARLSSTRRVLFLVAGAGKRAAVAAWRSGARIPAAAIGARESVEVLLDAAANSPRAAR
jgi:6-phosphogluconolactonase